MRPIAEDLPQLPQQPAHAPQEPAPTGGEKGAVHPPALRHAGFHPVRCPGTDTSCPRHSESTQRLPQDAQAIHPSPPGEPVEHLPRSPAKHHDGVLPEGQKKILRQPSARLRMLLLQVEYFRYRNICTTVSRRR